MFHMTNRKHGLTRHDRTVSTISSASSASSINLSDKHDPKQEILQVNKTVKTNITQQSHFIIFSNSNQRLVKCV